MLKLNSNNQN